MRTPGIPLAVVWAGFPVLLVQGLRLRRTTLRLPDAAGESGWVEPAGSRGPELSLVLVGDSVAAGVGLEHHDRSLAGHLATRLAESRGFAVAWRVLARTGSTAGDVRRLVAAADLTDADVVVLSVGVNDTKDLHPDRRWREELTALLEELERAAPSADVVLLGVPPMAVFPALPQPLATLLGARARRMDAIGRQVAASRPRVRGVELELPKGGDHFAADGFHPSETVHARLADQVAAVLA